MYYTYVLYVSIMYVCIRELNKIKIETNNVQKRNHQTFMKLSFTLSKCIILSCMMYSYGGSPYTTTLLVHGTHL